MKGDAQTWKAEDAICYDVITVVPDRKNYAMMATFSKSTTNNTGRDALAGLSCTYTAN